MKNNSVYKEPASGMICSANYLHNTRVIHEWHHQLFDPSSLIYSLYHTYYTFVIKFSSILSLSPPPPPRKKNDDVINGSPNLGSGSSVVSEWPSQPALHLAQAKPKYTKQDQGIFGAKVKPVFSGGNVCMLKTFILRIIIKKRSQGWF